MKNLNKSSMLFMLLAFSAFAGESTGGGNGGGGILCLNSAGEKTVRLLDLREAERSGLRILRTNIHFSLQLENALQKYGQIHKDYVALMRTELKYMEENTVFVGEKRLPPPSDTRLSILEEPRNCFLEGVANYNDQEGKLYLDSELDALMPETDRAALRFHEAWYRVQRQHMSPTDNSQMARKVTGAVFANEALNVVDPEEGIENAVSICRSEDDKYTFYVIPGDSGAIEILFKKINGVTQGERAAIIVEGDVTKMKIDKDFMNSLSEGLVTSTHPTTKKEKVFGSSGISLLSQGSLFASTATTYGAPMQILIATSDWISNESEETLESISRYGFKETDWAMSWKVKKPMTYENYSNYISINTANTNIFTNPNYSNGINSRFVCQKIK